MIEAISYNKTYRLHSFVLFFSLFVLFLASHAFAQSKSDGSQKSNPVGAGSGWNAEITTGEQSNRPTDMDDETLAFVQSISDYFNAITNMHGIFHQVDSSNQKTRGRFYIKRPGRLRFNYASPSTLRIIADGKWLAIEDHDLKTQDLYPLESTPFRLLLAEKVDLLKEARIVDISRGEEVAIISLSDKTDENSGQLKLFFTIPELKLTQWVITDPNGLDTRIEISELNFEKNLEDKYFKVSEEINTEALGN